ncbi:2-hydroxyacid dehydrogenase [Caldalkalibacillus mannanilyticus]|uniref:2-hydroxyacid dehydrogenase n=1 Tax=Caldalkalibacillus mannanilyticus TaxID=1418 RepID=UPI0004684CE3|nr:D-glycerate dehydrogenase [Caldalkalibacillus mannanilyticus]
MSKPYVFITMKIPDEAIEKLSEVAHVSVWEGDSPVSRQRLLDEVQKADALLCMLTDSIDQQILDNGTHLKIVANMAVGYDNIAIPYAAEKGIVVTNTPEVLSEATADLTFALMLTTARRIVEASSFLRNGEWTSWSPLLLAGQDVYDATLGIIGMGRIGEGVARRAKGFDMRVLYYNRTRKKHAEERLGVEYCELDSLLKEADFVVVLTPLTSETKGLISTNQFKAMKKNAIFINTSRGAVVDEEALYQALLEKEIWGAGLDVFQQEPVSTEHPLLQLPNVVTLPHIGSASIKTRTEMALLAAENIIAVLQNKKPITPVC